MRLCTLAAGLLVVLGQAMSLPGTENSQIEVDPFAMELKLLRQQRVQVVGRESLVSAYEKFIERHLANPRVAEAMIEAGSYCEGDGSASGTESALRWYEAAAEKARAGSDPWVTAQFLIVGRLRDRTRSFEILDAIAENCKDDPAIWIRVEGGRLSECIRTQDLVGAEKHCFALMDWCYDPKNVQKDLKANLVINRERLTAGSRMVQAWVTAPWPKAERKRAIQEYSERCASGCQGLLDEAESAIQSIDAAPN